MISQQITAFLAMAAIMEPGDEFDWIHHILTKRPLSPGTRLSGTMESLAVRIHGGIGSEGEDALGYLKGLDSPIGTRMP